MFDADIHMSHTVLLPLVLMFIYVCYRVFLFSLLVSSVSRLLLLPQVSLSICTAIPKDGQL